MAYNILLLDAHGTALRSDGLLEDTAVGGLCLGIESTSDATGPFVSEFPVAFLLIVPKRVAGNSHLEKARWAANYSLTVLDELLKRVAARLDADSAPDLADSYPETGHRECMERMVHAIGLEQLTFDVIRDKSQDFGEDYGLPALPTATRPPSPRGSKTRSNATPRRGKEWWSQGLSDRRSKKMAGRC